MTIMQKAIMQAIKEHNSKDDYLQDFNKCIKLVSMGPDKERGGYGTTYHCEYPNKDRDDWTVCNKIDDVFMRLTVKCSFKPAEKYDNNIVVYEVMLISSGEIVIYFDGTEYKA